MPTTLVQRFGANASIDTTNASDPVLRIRFSDLASTGWTSLANNAATDGDKWLTALILMSRQLETTLTTQTHKVTVVSSVVGLTQRNNATHRSYLFTCTVFTPDSGASLPDPDEVV